jgi:hypothetical protein
MANAAVFGESLEAYLQSIFSQNTNIGMHRRLKDS